MDVLTLLWVTVGSAGLTFALLGRREVGRDRRAAHFIGADDATKTFVAEQLRAAWFRVSELFLAVTAGMFPLAFPRGPDRPAWVRVVTILLFISLEVLLAVDAGLAWRAKRRFLARFGLKESV